MNKIIFNPYQANFFFRFFCCTFVLVNNKY